MPDLLNECLDLVRPSAEAKGLALVMAPAPMLRLFADITRVQQVLLNLLGNAIKFTTAGSVEVRLQSIHARTAVRIEIVDTGPGIWARHRNKLFQLFERLNAEAVSGVEGSGLGLALSAKLTKLMGGSIGHADNPAGGSIFWIELPCGAPPPEAAENAMPASAGLRRHLRVLVADDEAMNRTIVSGFLAIAEHEVVCVDSGAAAVEAAATQDFDVILMDVRMPGMNGLQATRRIRALPDARGKVPVIAVTAHAFTKQIETCRQAGMDGHISKPFKQGTLLAALGEIVARAGETRQLSPAMTPPGVKQPVLDRSTFDEIAQTLPGSDLTENLRILMLRCETLLAGLQGPELLPQADALAETAHRLAGGAGTLGFLRVAAAARLFEVAADDRAPETNVQAERLATAINESLPAVRKEIERLAAATV